MKKTNVHLYDYHDYREFLKAWFEQAKKNSEVSMREAAEKCDLATGYLPMVINGKRNLSKKALLKLQPLLSLSQNEMVYFELLLSLCDASQADERLAAFEELKKIRTFRNKSPKELEVHQYLSNWLNVTIREMAFRSDFSPNAEWIRERLVMKTPVKKIESSLQFLIEQGFLVKNAKGILKPSTKHLNCFSGVYKLSLGEFHKQMFSMASNSIDVTPRDQRNLLGHSFLIPEDKVEALRSILDEALQKVELLCAETSEPGPIYHVSLATFPLAQKGED